MHGRTTAIFIHKNKIDKLSRVVGKQSTAAVICSPETCCDSTITNNEIKIPNHVLLRRDINRRGGVCMYIRKESAHNCTTKDLPHETM